MHHTVALRTNKTWALLLFSTLLASCGEEEQRTTSSDSSTNLSNQITSGVNQYVAGTYRGNARFQLANDDLGYEESRTEQVVISIGDNGYAVVVIGDYRANVAFDNDTGKGMYLVDYDVSDFRCQGYAPYTLTGDDRTITGTIEWTGACTHNSNEDQVVHLTAKVRAIQ